MILRFLHTFTKNFGGSRTYGSDLTTVLLPRLLDLGNQELHDSRLGKSAQVTQLILLLIDNLPQDSPHDLATARLGQIRDDVDLLGDGKGTDDLADLEDKLLREIGLSVNIKVPGIKVSNVRRDGLGHTV